MSLLMKDTYWLEKTIVMHIAHFIVFVLSNTAGLPKLTVCTASIRALNIS